MFLLEKYNVGEEVLVMWMVIVLVEFVFVDRVDLFEVDFGIDRMLDDE